MSDPMSQKNRGFDDATEYLLAEERDGDRANIEAYYKPPQAHGYPGHTDDDWAEHEGCDRCDYIDGWIDGISK